MNLVVNMQLFHFFQWQMIYLVAIVNNDSEFLGLFQEFSKYNSLKKEATILTVLFWKPNTIAFKVCWFGTLN